MSQPPGRNAKRLENMSERECVRLLRSSQLGRIAVIDREHRPLIFPVNYFFDEGIVVFRTGKGSKLELAPGAHVCFEIDGWAPGAGMGWSVMVKGIAHDITESRSMPTARIRHWPVRPLAPGSRENWIGIWADEITGRRFETGPQREAR